MCIKEGAIVGMGTKRQRYVERETKTLDLALPMLRASENSIFVFGLLKQAGKCSIVKLQGKFPHKKLKVRSNPLDERFTTYNKHCDREYFRNNE
ncbi:Hypothetical predicted protein [Olea europaea subsp. europaea]|uniref:Uncharacterized protein n=1 Tax=Olea europaea subsp. europaea TaxID=158383 RepID=A0A8S0SPW4_OLEEU|nr:Hypothetical predicted protein [Olea europaea subsp. europaea]